MTFALIFLMSYTAVILISNSQVNATHLAPNDWRVQLMGTKPELNTPCRVMQLFDLQMSQNCTINCVINVIAISQSVIPKSQEVALRKVKCSTVVMQRLPDLQILFCRCKTTCWFGADPNKSITSIIIILAFSVEMTITTKHESFAVAVSVNIIALWFLDCIVQP